MKNTEFIYANKVKYRKKSNFLILNKLITFLILLLSATIIGCNEIIYTPPCPPNCTRQINFVTPEPLPSDLQLISQNTLTENNPIFCGKTSVNNYISAPYDLVVSDDGKIIYWIGLRKYLFNKNYFTASPQIIYSLNLEDKNPKPIPLSYEKNDYLSCIFGDNIEINSSNKLYIIAPYEKSVYSIDPSSKTVSKIFEDSLDSNPPEIDYMTPSMKTSVIPHSKGDYQIRGLTNLYINNFDKLFYTSAIQKNNEINLYLKTVDDKQKSHFLKPSMFSHVILRAFDFSNTKKLTSHTWIDNNNQLYASIPKENIIIKIKNTEIDTINFSEYEKIYQYYYKNREIFAGTSIGLANGIKNESKFNSPNGIAFDNLGNVYIADSGNYAVRKISNTGIVSTIYQVPESLREKK